MTTPLWTYWEGPMPRWIEVCLASMKALCTSGLEFHLVTPANVFEYLPRDFLLPQLSLLHHLSHRSDYYRAALLYLHGGFYFDADTAGLKNPTPLSADEKFVYTT